ncbi:LuxR C-terminal-related transcriptional regulator [Pseudonocardia lacus]|uniref:LuxR C-terminal-related transcriptional regulator n=1 Tax=Pseudonocardia lacus TaxID=2835865 RepID=UPI001BDD7AE3|nr:LuxR C-terminal-related transcriptional regulator [Pseudonocardia lacus]
MPERPPVVVLGRTDMLVTAMVVALRARRHTVERVATQDALGARLVTGSRGVLVVALDERGVEVVARAVAAGWVVLAIGADRAPRLAAAAVAAGAGGWLPETSSFAAFVAALDAALAGRPMMTDEQRREWLRIHDEHRETADRLRERLDRLTGREREVLVHLAAGRRPSEISGQLFLSITTVRTHIRSILKKLEVNSHTRAAELYRQLGARTV